MRLIGQIFAVMALMHLLAALVLVGWLAGTDRLNRQRLVAVKQMFAQTITEQRQADQKAEAEAAEQAERQAARARAEGKGPQSTAEELAEERTRDELMLRQLERTRRELEDLRRNLQISRMRMERQQQDLVEAQRAVEAKAKQIKQRLNEEGFQKAVALYQTMPPKQVKEHFLQLVQQEKVEEVVNYLEAMEPRKAANVLREFKTDQEITHAVRLTERLRGRGSDLVADLKDIVG
jgi:flagellar motility protein MotE (MotC chaperone)